MYCPKCGREISNSQFCSYCGTPVTQPPIQTGNSKLKKKFYKRWWFWLIVVIVVLGIGGSSGSGDDTDKTTNQTTISEKAEKNSYTERIAEFTDSTSTARSTTTTKSTTTEAPTTNVAEFKQSCVALDYKAVERDPSLYENKPVKFSGKVVQVSESGKWFSDDTALTLRIDTKEGEYGIWEDTVYVEYTLPAGSSRILEDDMVTVYGTCTGVTTYTAILGNSITIPSVDAVAIELK